VIKVKKVNYVHCVNHRSLSFSANKRIHKKEVLVDGGLVEKGGNSQKNVCFFKTSFSRIFFFFFFSSMHGQEKSKGGRPDNC
jgi:hypothetical protein